MLSPNAGYRRSRGILKYIFDSPEEVSRSPVDGLLEGVSMNRLEAGAPSDFKLGMEAYAVALEQMQ